mmetsp:Transcript_66885/g.104547  ORF Transcript_66885/g.104547 Transcript_66885/m.104547 type:complete len:290 (-) Transcript_66885:206-1075(-)|eukprot:CAMPEP_0169394318 /NCGR_PEP_ID=MMETSP1017-20121227/49940_1 /TAXON_ID=342587 /ORGANISM="Karlodinium micrum, Strain CCMP2283" /LENGTH=289 /DNA_ID=CAMNT_0009498021 /DNA_START=50 /DNA_END=922 /DNA_ORIENTATION=-
MRILISVLALLACRNDALRPSMQRAQQRICRELAESKRLRPNAQARPANPSRALQALLLATGPPTRLGGAQSLRSFCPHTSVMLDGNPDIDSSFDFGEITDSEDEEWAEELREELKHWMVWGTRINSTAAYLDHHNSKEMKENPYDWGWGGIPDAKWVNSTGFVEHDWSDESKEPDPTKEFLLDKRAYATGGWAKYPDGKIYRTLRYDEDLSEVEVAEQAAKLEALADKWKKRDLEIQDENARLVGWTKNAEINNGRLAMFFLIVGLITEYYTGDSLPQQIDLFGDYLR